MTTTGDHGLRDFLAYLRDHRKAILDIGTPLTFCLSLFEGGAGSRHADAAQAMIASLDRDIQDYAISSAYARLIEPDRRKALSAYFTPPALAQATLDAILSFIEPGPGLPTIIDPSCGGGSFLVPTARRLIALQVGRGIGVDAACREALAAIRGIEIDPGLAKLSARLLARMVRAEWHLEADTSGSVRCDDALATRLERRFDLAIGNPPYSKVWKAGAEAIRDLAGKAYLGGHTNLYGLFVIRTLDWLRPGGGLAFILPTSFVAGPYFAGLREEILDRASVVRIDLHQQRSDLFLDATQDVCLLLLRRHPAEPAPTTRRYTLGVISETGVRTELGTGETGAGGESWALPVPTEEEEEPHAVTLVDDGGGGATIADYGYRVRVGKVVPHREATRLFSRPARGRLPVLWASDVRPDGSFQYQGGTRTADAAWYGPADPDYVPYASFGRSVLVQRTSNRDQQRRLNAAAITREFAELHAHRGYVGENHVILLEPISDRPAVDPDMLADILNSPVANQRFSAVSGSFSVSARLLARLALPNPADIPRGAKARRRALPELFAALEAILVPADR